MGAPSPDSATAGMRLCDRTDVFAFGLDEMESLGVLGQTEAGDYLYDLSAGVDRVSLARVFRSLNSERDALLDATTLT